MEHGVAWIRYQHRHSPTLDDPVSQRMKGCQLFPLPAVPAPSATPHKGTGEKRQHLKTEDRRGARAMTKGDSENSKRGLTLQLWSHQRPQVWAWLAGQGQWLCSWRVLTPLSPSFISTTGIADCISEKTLNPVAQIDLKSCSSCWKDTTEALRGKTRKGKRGCSLSGCTWLQEATGCYPIRDFCSSKYFLGKVSNPCNICW